MRDDRPMCGISLGSKFLFHFEKHFPLATRQDFSLKIVILVNSIKIMFLITLRLITSKRKRIIQVFSFPRSLIIPIER